MSDQTTGPGGPERFADAARRYRLDARIATGGMGEVWRATDTALGRTVAVKLLKSEYADDATFRSRFESEARHAASLHHPNVAAVYDVGQSPPELRADGSGARPASFGVPFLVMELVDGQPLSELLRGGRVLDPTAMRGLLVQAADAIGAAHDAGIVHRDVKPANLMITPDRQVKITDFGIASAGDGLGLTSTGQVMGTPQYLSPEQARGHDATSASDVYSLGVVAWECLAGRRPFERESAVATALAHLNDPVPALPDSIPADLAAVVERALAKDPAERYPDGAALAAALRDPATAATQIVGTSRSPLPPVVPTPAAEATSVMPAVSPRTPVEPLRTDGVGDRPGDRADRRDGPSPWWLFLGIVVLGAIAVALVLYATRGGSDDPTDPVTPPTSASAPSPTEEESPTQEDSPTPEEPETFDLDEGSYLGENVDDVVRDLQNQGLTVRTEAVDNPGDEDADSVESVSPTQGLAEGDTVRVRYYGEEPETEAPSTPAPSTPAAPSSTPPASTGTTGGAPTAGTTGTAETTGAPSTSAAPS